MSAKPGTPVTRKEMYLDVMAGGSSNLPEPVTIEEKYLAKIAGMTVDLPAPVPLKHKFLAKIAGMQVDVPTYTTGLPRIYAYLAKAAGQEVEVPQPITREEMYWFDYVGGQPAPPEREYTGAVPVTFTANGQPLLDYLISGNTVQSGIPTPDSPIMPQGCEERTGNLFDFEQLKNAPSGTIGSITFSHVLTLKLKENTYYTMASNGTGSTNSTPDNLYRSVYFNATIGESSVNKDNPVTVLTDSTGFVRIGFFSERTNAQQYLSGEAQLWINEGSTPLPYEPYGFKIPISSASTTTPVYLGEVETTRKIKKLVLTGDETWEMSSNTVYITNFGVVNQSPLICTHFPNKQSTGMWNGNNWVFQVNISQHRMTTKAEWTTYLQTQYAAGTPVTVWYVLATAVSSVVNEPLMKIGDYADTLSMEQAGVEIPTVSGSNTLDVLTTVKPSEVYIKYKGEPVAGSQTSSQSSAYAPAEVSGQSESIDDINSNSLGKEEETE